MKRYPKHIEQAAYQYALSPCLCAACERQTSAAYTTPSSAYGTAEYVAAYGYTDHALRMLGARFELRIADQSNGK